MRHLTFRRLVLVAFATAGVIAFAAPAPAPAQENADVVRRELLVVDANGKALDGGGSSTPFSVVLEGADECPGDSAHDQYRIDSYMVPVDADPTQLKFTGFGPTPPTFRSYDGFQMPLYKLSDNPYAAQFTSQQAEAGGPGPIPELPPFGWDVYVPTTGIDGYEGGLPSGEYRVGIACTQGARITNLWETTIEVTQDAADKPVGIAWTVTGPQPGELESEARLGSTSSSGSSANSGTSWFVFALVAFSVVMLIVAIVLFRSSRRDTQDPDDPDTAPDDEHERVPA